MSHVHTVQSQTTSYSPCYADLAPAIDELKPVVSRHIKQSEKDRHLHAEVASNMARVGLYRIGVPRVLGGLECHPEDQVRVIEAISRMHGSAGWNLMIGVEVMGALSTAYPVDVLKPIFNDPELIISGALNPLGKVWEDGDEFVVTGQWPFASGVHNAHYFWSQSFQVASKQSTEKVRDEQGPQLMESLVASDQYTILDTWHVSGMRASGSHDVHIDEIRVPARLVSRSSRKSDYQTSTLYRLPSHSRLAFNKVGVASGIALAAIDAFTELATAKKPRASSGILAEREDAQWAVSQAERLVGAARAYVFDRVGAMWRQVERGDTPTRKDRARLQLACSAAAQDAVTAVEHLHSASGVSANFLSSPLEQLRRDVAVVRQHIMVSPQYQHAVGRVLLGLDSGTFLF